MFFDVFERQVKERCDGSEGHWCISLIKSKLKVSLRIVKTNKNIISLVDLIVFIKWDFLKEKKWGRCSIYNKKRHRPVKWGRFFFSV